MKKLFSNTAFNVGVIILIGGLVLWISMSIGDPEVILSTVLSANPFYIFLAFLFVLLWQLLVGFCLMVLTHITHPEYKLREGYLNAFIAALFHDLTPSATFSQRRTDRPVLCFQKAGGKIRRCRQHPLDGIYHLSDFTHDLKSCLDHLEVRLLLFRIF